MRSKTGSESGSAGVNGIGIVLPRALLRWIVDGWARTDSGSLARSSLARSGRRLSGRWSWLRNLHVR